MGSEMCIRDSNSGSGCDLSAAAHVVVLDIIEGETDYVIGLERQAISRCYRIGQKRDVTVVRFLARDTIESERYREAYANINYSSFFSYD